MFIPDHPIKILNVGTMFEEKMNSRRQDQCLNLREFDALERLLEQGST